MSQMTVAQLKELKTKLKTELTRRTGYGPTTDPSYHGRVDTYASRITASVGDEVYIEAADGANLIDNLLQIQDYSDLKFVKKNEPIPAGFDYTKLKELLTKLAAQDYRSGVSTCRGMCTGICYGSCVNSCYDSCHSTCGDACVSNCTGGAR